MCADECQPFRDAVFFTRRYGGAEPHGILNFPFVISRRAHRGRRGYSHPTSLYGANGAVQSPIERPPRRVPILWQASGDSSLRLPSQPGWNDARGEVFWRRYCNSQKNCCHGATVGSINTDLRRFTVYRKRYLYHYQMAWILNRYQ